jgi:hypothetical protein
MLFVKNDSWSSFDCVASRLCRLSETIESLRPRKLRTIHRMLDKVKLYSLCMVAESLSCYSWYKHTQVVIESFSGCKQG